MDIKGVMLLIITLISEVVLSAVNIENVPTYPKIYQNPLILGATTQNSNGNFNQRQLLLIQRNKNGTQGIYPQAQHLLTNPQLSYLPDQNIKDSNYRPRNDGGVQNIHYTNLKPLSAIDFEIPVNEFKHTLNSPRGYYLSQAGIEQRRIDTAFQPSIQYFNQGGLKNNGYNPNNENVPKFQSVKFKINPDITLPLAFINTKRNDISLEQQIPIVPNVKNYYQEIRNIPSAINTGNQNERNINPNQNHLFQTGSGYLTHENKLNALKILNNQPKESRPGNNTTKKKLSTGKSDHNKRYKVIHNNGAVEYYDDLYVILKKYPHIKIANNILYSRITQNMNFNKVHNISPVIPIVGTKPLVNSKIDVPKPSNILKDHADVFSQYKNEQAYQKPPNPVEEKDLLKKIANKIPEKPFVPQLSSLKLNQNIQVQPSMLENNNKNIVTTYALAKGSENTYISSFKTEHIAGLNVGNEAQLLAHRLDNVVEQPVTHTSSNNHHPEVSLLQSAPNILSESSKSKNTTVIKNYSNQNSNITKPITISSVLNENKNKNMTTAVKLDTKTNVEKSPAFNITSGLSKNQTEYNTNLYKENIFDPIRTVNLTTPECFDENFSIKQNVTESKSELPDNTENVNSTEDSINNKGDQDKDYLSLSKPQMWLRTTDPDFWKKLIDDNDAYSFVYIFDIQSQSKVEKDTKTTIYPNGTVMEEITETIWENGDGDEPKVFKTVKVTYPDDEKKDKNT